MCGSVGKWWGVGRGGCGGKGRVMTWIPVIDLAEAVSWFVPMRNTSISKVFSLALTEEIKLLFKSWRLRYSHNRLELMNRI